MYRACELKDQTYKKTRTLHFSEKSEGSVSRGFQTVVGDSRRSRGLKRGKKRGESEVKEVKLRLKTRRGLLVKQPGVLSKDEIRPSYKGPFS